MSIADTVAQLTPQVKELARPFAIYSMATACAVAVVQHPDPDMLGWGVAGLTALAGARTADKIWGRRLPPVPPVDGAGSGPEKGA